MFETERRGQIKKAYIETDPTMKSKLATDIRVSYDDT
jgi:hypothetical protein